MNTRKRLMFVFAMMLTTSNAVPLRADVLLRTAVEYQHTSPEGLKIKVKSVEVDEYRDKRTLYSYYNVRAVALVLEVTRSETGLKVGQEIVIEYSTVIREGSHRRPPLPLKKGQTTGAFLTFKEETKCYEPFAHHRSCLSDPIVVDESAPAMDQLWMDYAERRDNSAGS